MLSTNAHVFCCPQTHTCASRILELEKMIAWQVGGRKPIILETGDGYRRSCTAQPLGFKINVLTAPAISAPFTNSPHSLSTEAAAGETQTVLPQGASAKRAKRSAADGMTWVGQASAVPSSAGPRQRTPAWCAPPPASASGAAPRPPPTGSGRVKGEEPPFHPPPPRAERGPERDRDLGDGLGDLPVHGARGAWGWGAFCACILHSFRHSHRHFHSSL